MLDHNTGKKSVLAVDDDYDIVTLIEQALSRCGFKVSAFTDPVIALEDFRVNCNTCSLFYPIIECLE